MNNQDQALLMLGSIGLSSAVIAFFIRRSRGKSRALATVFAIWVFGSVLAAGFLFGVFPFSRHSMGLERFVVPFILMIATAVLSAIFGLLVHLFDHKTMAPAESLSLEAQVLLQSVEHEMTDQTVSAHSISVSENTESLPAWKRFAIQSARQSLES